MEIYIEKEDPCLWVKKLIAVVFIGVIAIGILGAVFIKISGVYANSSLEYEKELSGLTAMGGDTLIGVSNPVEPLRIRRVRVVITAYSSTIWQTDSTPFITASGEYVRDGIVANNMLPFGTKIRIPELYGDKIFIVEDRMNSRKGNYHVDVWFEEYHQAKDFGAKFTYIEVLES